MSAQTTNSAITCAIEKGRPLKIPIAHGEGRYYADDKTISGLVAHDQILFKYCDAKGDVVPEVNPNGALLNIAGICNQNRNVFGMMPHPERAADPELSNTDGRLVFESILHHCDVAV